MTNITATTLYNLVQCPERVERDFFASPVDRDPISPFIAMLWERGTLYEKEVIASWEHKFLDLSEAPDEDKERLTLEAMQRGERLIYNGRIAVAGLVGVPDLLRRHGEGYLPLDIKSGRGDRSVCRVSSSGGCFYGSIRSSFIGRHRRIFPIFNEPLQLPCPFDLRFGFTT